MTKRLFIAYHGTYDETGSLAKAVKIYRYLKERGIDCYLFAREAGTNTDAFVNTPGIAADCSHFLLVCNENIRRDDNGRLLNNGVLQEVKSFYKRIYSGKSHDGDARVYGFGKMTYSMANDLFHAFEGVAHYIEEDQGEEKCLEAVYAWLTTEKEESVPVRNDIRKEFREVSRHLYERYSLPSSFSMELLPKIRYEGGKVLDNILALDPEEKRSYVLTANGGSGKSSSLKCFWREKLDSSFLPLYIPVRRVSEDFAASDHPLFDYLKKNYPLFSGDIPSYLRSHRELSFLLLFDGYNEAEDVSGISADFEEIREEVTSLITTRDRSFLEDLRSRDLIFLELLPLEEKVVRSYIASYQSEELNSLLSDPNMMVMLRNPMLLSMFCHSFDEDSYDLHTSLSGDLTAGELIERCVIAQLKKSGSVNLHTFFSTLVLFPMTLAEMYYSGSLNNMTASRIDLSKGVLSLLGKLDIDTLEVFYLPEYADSWGLEISDEEYESLTSFLRERKPLAVRNELSSFEKTMSNVLQFFSVDDERSRIGGALYRFSHQTSLNWFLAYGISRMAVLMPERFEEILRELTAGFDSSPENTDDYQEQGEFLFDLIRESGEGEAYRHFLNRLFQDNFKRRTSRIYDIATAAISLFDRSKVSEEEYCESVPSCILSLFSLGKRNTPPGKNEEEIIEAYGSKLEGILKRAQRIEDPLKRDIVTARIQTIQGAYSLAKRRMASLQKEDPAVLYELAKKAEDFQLSALRKREELLENGPTEIHDEILNRISYSYTSLGTVSYFLQDYDRSISCHQKAYDIRKQLSSDEKVAEDIRKDAAVTSAINLNRLNGSLLQKGDPDKKTLQEIFEREELLLDTAIQAEKLNQVNNFEKEISFLTHDEKTLSQAEELYEKISASYQKLFGYQSDKLLSIRRTLLKKRKQIEEIRKAKEEIRDFFASSAFQKIVTLFNKDQREEDPEKIALLSEEWDYRKKMAAGGERQAITTEDAFVADHREEIISCFRELGMLEEREGDFPLPDYILPLGGYGATNLRRCLLAKKIYDRYPGEKIDVIALSSHREISSEAEFEQLKDFAPEAKSEFEEMDMAMKEAFGLSGSSTESHNERNSREYWSLTVYDSPSASSFYNLSAPCLDPKRTRANTTDTFVHFLNCFTVKEGAQIFLISTALYGPYQYYSLLPSAIEYGVDLTFIGGDYKKKDSEILATLCLADLRSAVNAMVSFLRNYPEGSL